MKDKYAKYYIKGKTAEEAVGRLVKIIELLRSDEGCPWDKAQTHESIKTCLLEEACEVAEAIENRDIDNLEEELGDVLLQVVFHADLGKRAGSFDLCSIANRECDKMIRRHPDIFLNKNTETIDKTLEKWENVKRKEQGNVTHTQNMINTPRTLPSLIRSYKIQKKAAQAGFDWDDVDGAFSKIQEEAQELLNAYQGNDEAKIVEEIGDLLFSIVNVARFLEINPEEALNLTAKKFIDRFAYIEETAQNQGQPLEEMSLEEMDRLWDEAKKIKEQKWQQTLE